MTDDSLLEFPCRFPIKVFGAHDGHFEQQVFDLLKPHVPELSQDDLTRNPSRKGNYVAITVDVIARDRAQLDAIYEDLTACAAVLMAL